MSKLSNLIVLGASLGLSVAAYAAYDNPNVNPNNNPTVTTITEQNKVMEKVNVNTADEKQLAKAKWVGKKKAKAIVDYRAQNGNFKSLDDLLNVKAKGISKKWLDKVSGELTI